MDAKACGKNEFRHPKTGRCNWRWMADGEVYNVRRKFIESFGGTALHIPINWYEYEVWLMDLKKGGEIIDQWDSAVETSHGRGLTEDTAKNAVEDIVDDINERYVDPESWFSNVGR